MSWHKILSKFFGRADSAWGFLSSDLIKPVTVPVATGFLVAASALISAVPLPYLLAATFFAMACTDTTLVRVDEWWSRINPSGKLDFSHPLLAPEIAIQDGLPQLIKMQFGFHLVSSASFPLKCQVESIFTQFSGRVVLRKDYDLRTVYDIPANGVFWFRDSSITIELPLETVALEGEISFRVSYWKSENRKFYCERKLRIQGNAGIPARALALNWVHT